MDKKNILILLIITALLVFLSVSIFYEPPGIKGIIVSDNLDDYDRYRSIAIPAFQKKSEEIFIILEAVNLSRKDFIDIIINMSDDIYQESQISVENDGSSIIKLSLLKKGDSFINGDYEAEVFLNEESVGKARFRID
mgnify:CR=1 FL=1